MADIIKSDSITFYEIKQNLIDYLQNSTYWEEVKDNLPDSTITIILELLAGFAVYQNYNSQMMRQETYLDTAKLSSSIYKIAKIFGYPINRMTAPIIKVKYNNIPTKLLKSGDTFGTYTDKINKKTYDIVYFGNDIKIEKGDEILLYLGNYQNLTKTVNYANEDFSVKLTPILNKSISNYLIKIDGSNVSKDIEDYIIKNKVTDYSDDIYSGTLFIANKEKEYGLYNLDEGEEVFIEYIETDGYIDNFNYKNLDLDEEFLFIDIEHQGTNGDSLEKIRKLTPYYYTTLRRMVTKEDHQYLIESHPLIKSAYPEKDDSQCCTVNVYYIKYNVIDDPITLTDTEQKSLSDFIDYHKMIATTVILIPAQKESLTFDIKVRVIDPTYQTIASQKIQDILSQYELKLNTSIKYGELLAEIAKITTIDNNETKKIIDYILPNQTSFDKDAKIDTYYKFDTVNITFIE